MKQWLRSLIAAAVLLGSYTKQPTPTPQLTGTWTQDHYTFDSPGQYLGRVKGTVSTPNTYMVVSEQQIEYHIPSFSAPFTQAYTRQGQQLHLAAGTPDDQLETITKLTNQELVLHLTRRTQVGISGLVQDSTVLDYTYTR